MKLILFFFFFTAFAQKNVFVTFIPTYSHFQMLEATTLQISKSYPGKYNFTFVSFTFEDFKYDKILKQHNNSLIHPHVCMDYNISITNIAKNIWKNFGIFRDSFNSYFDCLASLTKPDIIINENFITASYDYAYENKVPIIAASVYLNDIQIQERGLCQSNEPRLFQFLYGFSGYTENPILLLLSNLFCRNFLLRFTEFQNFFFNRRSYYKKSKLDWKNEPSLVSLVDRTPHMFFSYPGILSYNSFNQQNFHLVGPMILITPSGSEGLISKWIDENKDKELIYFNMGTLWSHTEERIEEIFKAVINILSKEKYAVIFRSNIEMEQRLSELLKLKSKSIQKRFFLSSKSLPQKLILSLKNTKLFLTHCGYSSVVESLYYGVPMLGLPIQVDQFSLCYRQSDFGYGRCGHKLPKEEIENNINYILNSKEIQDSVHNVSRILQTIEPHTEIEKFLDLGIKLGSFEKIYSKPMNRTYLSIFIDWITPLVEVLIVYFLYKCIKYILSCCICKKEKIE